MWGARLWGPAVLVAALSTGPSPSYAVASSAAATPARCSAGLVALTFDDGPSSNVTPRLLGILEERRVRATFFMVGERVASAPATARKVAQGGHVVANHSWHHTLMTTQTDSQIRDTLLATDRALRRAGVVPGKLMRPPYGEINARVTAAITRTGFVPVLWDIDPEDWEDRTATAIANAVIAGLRPHRRNIVLQHDGVTNSPSSVSAVPSIIQRARRLGYCFAVLGADGRPTPPVPRLTIASTTVREGDVARVRLRLDQPTSRPVSVRLDTRAAGAGAADFTGRSLRVRFPIGTTTRTVLVRTHQDSLDERNEAFSVRLSAPVGLRVGTSSRRVVIVDDDAPPGVRVRNLVVTEPATGTTPADVVVELGRPSGRRVVATLRTRPGTARAGDFTPRVASVVVPAGTVRAFFRVEVLADLLDEPEETFTVEITSAVNARVVATPATVTIRPPPTP
ncbi:polysaccharide deacetylase family protein [Nocardioides sp. Root151]|uniref:polysaccharide deacetylase family protein n=1 Tax=Nocardioides sp. Root151 TaxID=1736475 RepID=UPI0009EA9225|nr:polysaccharide deacetylase family protein [Nocardioides sp. Root151]